MSNSTPLPCPREEWRPVAGMPHYEVSSLGGIRSVDRTTVDRTGRKRFRPGQTLKGRDQFGYHWIDLYDKGRRKARGVHALICEAFNGPRPVSKSHCAHKDGNPRNNVPGNLYWATPKENAADRRRHGREYQLNKTACDRGHEFNERNTYWYDGRRHCRPCHNRRTSEHQSKNREWHSARQRRWRAERSQTSA